MKKKLRKALVQAGRMSTAVDRIKGALECGRPGDFGGAFEHLLRAKIKYDQLVEGMARDA